MKKYFITGGTGFVGRSLVQALLKQGNKVFLLVKPTKQFSPQERVTNIFPQHRDNLIVMAGDVRKSDLGISKRDLNKLKKEEVDYIWHLAANLAFNQSLTPGQKFKVNVLGTKNVVDFANQLNAVLCHCSTAYVCGDAKVFSEHSLNINQKFRNDYERTKHLAEKIVREGARVPYIIFRPSLIIDKLIPGKASNCTFGYYRYAFMFFLFRKWLIKCFKSGKISKLLLEIFGAKFEQDSKTIRLPFLVLPYPNKIKVNMVLMEYVIDSFLKVSSSPVAYNQTYHITHPKPRTFIYLMKSLLNDLSIKQVKFIGVNPNLFKLFFKLLYIVVIPWKGYVKSALLYLPYISTSPIFLRKNVNRYNAPPKVLTRSYLKKINLEAIEKVFPNIKV